MGSKFRIVVDGDCVGSTDAAKAVGQELIAQLRRVCTVESGRFLAGSAHAHIDTDLIHMLDNSLVEEKSGPAPIPPAEPDPFPAADESVAFEDELAYPPEGGA